MAWMFDRRAVFTVSIDDTDEESLFELILEAGAEDVAQSRDHFEITAGPDRFTAITEALASAEIVPESAEITRVPNNTVDLYAKTGHKVLQLLESLEDNDDVQSVIANFSIPDELMQELMDKESSM